MIISENRDPSLADFASLMANTDLLLNRDASERPNYFAGRNGTPLEEDVFGALISAADGTPFKDTIKLVSGKSFPDIVANNYYGVEVKSTNKNSWRSIGSSILESTRIETVERIYLTFGKLGAPIEFRSRPYEQCLYDISVTHYPRYLIDMDITEDKTIFKKMGIAYDELRKMDNPVDPVSKYYRNLLKPGESLWWAADNNLEESSAPMKVSLWTSLDAAEKSLLTTKCYALFPEIFGSSQTKYQRAALWMVTTFGVVNTNIRDQFSAGGQVNVIFGDKVYKNLPAVFGRITVCFRDIAQYILSCSPEVLSDCWNCFSVSSDRISQWCDLVLRHVNQEDYSEIRDLLRSLFREYLTDDTSGLSSSYTPYVVLSRNEK